MGYVRNFTGAQPGERDDGRPYVEVRFDEAPDVDGAPGAWTAIDTQDLDPVDTNPAAPAARDLTTEEATLETGWYRLVFIDADGDEDRTDPVAYPPIDTVRPSISDIATLLRARTTNAVGETGAFTSSTKPTADQVDALIGVAYAFVTQRAGEDALTRAPQLARHACALYTAMLVELSYYPEQTDEDGSAYQRFKEQFEEAMIALIGAAHEGGRTGRMESVALESPYSGDTYTPGALLDFFVP